MKRLETERLILRDFTIDDLNNLTTLDTNPDVMKFIGEGKTPSKDQIEVNLKIILETYSGESQFGLWAAETKDNEFIGWFALKPIKSLNQIEIGYRLLTESWGKGYATEGAKKVIEYGFEIAKLEKIIAVTHPDNIASQKVLIKSGLTQKENIPNPFEQYKDLKEVCYFEILGKKI